MDANEREPDRYCACPVEKEISGLVRITREDSPLIDSLRHQYTRGFPVCIVVCKAIVAHSLVA